MFYIRNGVIRIPLSSWTILRVELANERCCEMDDRINTDDVRTYDPVSNNYVFYVEHCWQRLNIVPNPVFPWGGGREKTA